MIVLLINVCFNDQNIKIQRIRILIKYNNENNSFTNWSNWTIGQTKFNIYYDQNDNTLKNVMNLYK